MKLLIIAHYGQQPPLNTMRRYHNWAKELVKRGNEVTIIAASALHNTKIDYIDKLGKERDCYEGVKYIYIKTSQYSGNGIGRMKNMLQFCLGIKKYNNLQPDVVIICEAYLFRFAKCAFRKIPIITDTADLWPESIVEYTNFSRRNPLIKYLYYLEKTAYLNSDALIFSMEGGVDYLKEQIYANKIDYSRVFHINMGCDIEQKDKELEGVYFDLEWNSNTFNIVYCGSIRVANQVQQICNTAKIIKDRGYRDIQFQIYGNGDDLEFLQKYIIDNCIDNVHFYGRIEKEKIPFILANGKANLLTYKNVPIWKYGGSQSKLFDYLASGRPIICNVKFGYNLIERYNCGVVAESDSAYAVADAIEQLYKTDPAELTIMGQNSRKVAEMYDQPLIVDKLCEVIDFVKR